MTEGADTATAADVVAGSFFASTVTVWGNGPGCPFFLLRLNGFW